MFEERNQLLSSNDHLRPYLYDWNGIPCTPIFLKMVVLDLQDLVMYCPITRGWQQQQTKKLEDIFKHVKCSFHDLKKTAI